MACGVLASRKVEDLPVYNLSVIKGNVAGKHHGWQRFELHKCGFGCLTKLMAVVGAVFLYSKTTESGIIDASGGVK